MKSEVHPNTTLLEIIENHEKSGRVLDRDLKLVMMACIREFITTRCANPPKPSLAEKKLIAAWIVKQCPIAGPLVST